MDWKRAIEEERAALGRIVALLCALADLAERAAGRSAIVRSLVLWFLRHAETVARDFVEDADAPSAMLPVGPAGTAAADALRLAAILRALARDLDRQARLLAAPCHHASDGAAASPSGRIKAFHDTLVSLSGLAAFVPNVGYRPRAPDTS